MSQHPVRHLASRTRAVSPTLEVLESRTLLSFTSPVAYNVGTQADAFVPNAVPIGVVAADFNTDGKLDLAVAHKVDNSIYLLLGNGNGTFQPAVQIAVGESIEGREFVGDFNGDTKLDLFLPGGANQAIILLGNGNGTFQPRIDSSSFAVAGSYPRGWSVGDFNGDKKLDVASTRPSTSADSGGYIVLLGNGNGTFQPGIIGPMMLHYSRWSATGDFNKDGKLDLAVADGQGSSSNTGTAELSILLGNGNGTFQAPVSYTSPQFPDDDDPNATANPEDVAVADVNNDGKLDALVSDYDNTVNVFLGNGNGTFQAARGYETGHYPRSVVPADVNHDGKVDLVVTNVGINVGGAEFNIIGAEPGSVAVLLGNGDGTFQDATPITLGFNYPGWTAVGDFNKDGLPDLAVTRVMDGHTVNVVLNRTSTGIAPTIATSARATPNPVTGTTTSLSVLGADDGGEANLTYTWTTINTPPAPVTFSVNGTNAAKNATATFTQSGVYNFQVTITDADGLSVTGTVNNVSVTLSTAQSLTSYSLSGDGRAAVFLDTGAGQAQWDAARSASTANNVDYTSALRSNWAGTGTFSANGVSIMRGFLAFDTTALPANAVITGVTLGVFLVGKQNAINDGKDFLSVVQGLQPAASILSSSDYTKAGNAITNPTEGSNRVDITGLADNAYATWSLNAAGISWIARGGYTKLAVREGHDLLNLWPSYVGQSGNSVHAYMSEQPGTSQDPYLKITYTLPSSTGSISGKVFNDANSNGSFDGGDTLLAGRTVYLDADNDNNLDAGERNVLTDSSGAYTLSGLAPGTYRVRRVLPIGYYLTNPSAGYYDVTITSGSAITGKDFAAAVDTVNAPTTFRVNAGGSAYTSTTGQFWEGDGGFTGGVTATSAFDVANTSDDPLYYTRRYGQNFTFSKAATNGNYTLTMLFAESYFTGVNQRKFSVFAEGSAVLSNFDLVAAGGGKAAITRSFNVSITDGKLDLSFIASLDNAIISGIQLTPR